MAEGTSNGRAVRDVNHPNKEDRIIQMLVPRSDWSGMGEAEHFVQFYETDGFLMDSLSDFISTGLSAGDGCIVVATDAHRAGLDQRLQIFGLDVAAATARGQYISLDAAGTLSSFLIDGWPEPERFAQIIGGTITRAANGRQRVRIFGEMVGLLCQEGKHEAAIHLEKLWNDLHKTHSFSLFCAYSMNCFGDEAATQPLIDVCRTHSSVIPAENYSVLADPKDRLNAITVLQQKARLLQAEIAERKEAEKALRSALEEREQLLIREQEARSEAEKANRLKDEFLATVSHELRTPLNAIIGWSYMLRDSKKDEATITRALEVIERNAKSQAQLIEDILDVSRIITGKLRLDVGPVDLASVINAAIDSVQFAADSKGIQIEVRLDPSVRHMFGDAARLQQVVWNLLSNAIKFTPSGGYVEVRLERAGPHLEITVSDSGHGINPTFLPFIFDRFRQCDATITRAHSGLGLGLAIVRHLVELHGGTVRAVSRGEGCGATFTISFPLVAAPEQPTTQVETTENLPLNEAADIDFNSLPGYLPSIAGVRVLLVDDDHDTLQILTIVLTDCMADVQTASSAAEALEALQWYKPDVMVFDLAMPHEDGYSLIRKVRSLGVEIGEQIPAVALTAYVRVEDRVRALSAGFNMFVPKPVEPNELIEVIASLTEHRTKTTSV